MMSNFELPRNTREIYSDADLKALVACEKRIMRKPPQMQLVNRNMSHRFSVVNGDAGITFEVFAKYSERKPADFSIGLMFGSFLLYRCNGFHGATKAGFYAWEHHARPHAHILTMEDITAGRESAPSLGMDLLNSYSNFQEARVCFFRNCGIINYSEFFDDYEQLALY